MMDVILENLLRPWIGSLSARHGEIARARAAKRRLDPCPPPPRKRLFFLGFSRSAADPLFRIFAPANFDPRVGRIKLNLARFFRGKLGDWSKWWLWSIWRRWYLWSWLRLDSREERDSLTLLFTLGWKWKSLCVKFSSNGLFLIYYPIMHYTLHTTSITRNWLIFPVTFDTKIEIPSWKNVNLNSTKS